MAASNLRLDTDRIKAPGERAVTMYIVTCTTCGFRRDGFRTERNALKEGNLHNDQMHTTTDETNEENGANEMTDESNTPAVDAEEMAAETATAPKAWTGKPIPDISGFSAKKRLALLKCWLGAAKYTPAAIAKYSPYIAAAEQDLALEQATQAREAAEAKQAKADAKAAAAEAAAQAKADAKAAKAAERAERKAAADAKVARDIAETETAPAVNDEDGEPSDATLDMLAIDPEAAKAARNARRKARRAAAKEAVAAE